MDLAAVHLKALEYIGMHETSIEFNVALGKGTSLLELLKICEEVTKRPIPFVIDPPNPGDPPCLIADPGEVWTTLGITPRFPRIKTMVEHAWQWMQLKRSIWLKQKQATKTHTMSPSALQASIT
jgi:UDP-glucose 4-epimerase